MSQQTAAKLRAARTEIRGLRNRIEILERERDASFAYAVLLHDLLGKARSGLALVMSETGLGEPFLKQVDAALAKNPINGGLHSQHTTHNVPGGGEAHASHLHSTPPGSHSGTSEEDSQGANTVVPDSAAPHQFDSSNEGRSSNLNFDGDGRVSASVDSIVKSEGFRQQLRATREIAGDVPAPDSSLMGAQAPSWADGMERAAELCDEEAHSARALLNENPHMGDMAKDRIAAVRDSVSMLAETIRSFKRAGPDDSLTDGSLEDRK